MTTLLIDGDILVYSVGFSSEERWYSIICPTTGEEKTFKSKKDIRLYNKDIADESITLCRIAEPPFMAKSIVDRTLKRWITKFKPKKFRIFLTDSVIKKNFRYVLNPQYKANRKDNIKPLHYDMLRGHLLARYNTEIVSGIEADDALGIHASHDTIIISKDKDLLQVPGRHYNITTGKEILATKLGELELWKDIAGKSRLRGTGFKWFCAQMLLGDDVDNIKGINRIGAVKTNALLKDAKDPIECWDIIKKVYEDHGRDDLIMNANMLWVLREENGFFDENKIR